MMIIIIITIIKIIIIIIIIKSIKCDRNGFLLLVFKFKKLSFNSSAASFGNKF